ncbi:MAG: type IV secretion system DNA-binding domain-containing protein, partial [Thiobacillus sp.]
ALRDGQQNVTSAGVLGNMMSYLSVVFDLARAWPRPGIFSIRDWLTGKNTATKSVVLQHNGEFESLARAFNGAVIALASQLINSPLMPESTSRRLWFFLDEFPQLGKVEAVFPLCEIGRSKGVRVVIGMQDISQLKKIYSDHQASALVSMVGTHVVTRVSSGETADFITEKLIGEREIERLDVSTSSGTGRSPGIFTPGGTRTSSWKLVREPVMLPSELLQLGPVPGQGVKVLVLGIGEDVLEVLIPFSDPRKLRSASVIADWTRFPRQPIAPAVAAPAQEPPEPTPSWAEEAAEAEAAPLQVTPIPPAVTPAAHAKSDDIDGDEAGEGEESAPAPETTTATDPLAFLDDGVSTEKTPATELETRVLPIATPLTSQLADQAKEEAAESVGGELAQHVGIAALPAGIAEIAHAVEIVDTIFDLAGAAMPSTDVLPVTEAGAQPPKKKKFRLKKSAAAQLEESI